MVVMESMEEARTAPLPTSSCQGGAQHRCSNLEFALKSQHVQSRCWELVGVGCGLQGTILSKYLLDS